VLRCVNVNRRYHDEFELKTAGLIGQFLKTKTRSMGCPMTNDQSYETVAERLATNLINYKKFSVNVKAVE
jgi:hypothetical protein